jgi:glutathione S-transferase
MSQRPRERYQLFQYDSCPFCYRVRRYLDEAGIEIELRDTLRDPAARAELIAGGGRPTVPCLRIERLDPGHEGEVRWLYESLDIIRYLEERRVAG